MFGNIDYINTVASESGRPEWRVLVPFCMSLPNNGRILIFFLYMLDSVFLYKILINSELFDEKASLYITLLFTIIPVNDSRILISNFAYSVGLFFFYLSFMLFIKWNKTKDINKNIVYRIILLLLFYISFILNSILAYYYIVIAYLFVLELKKQKTDNIIKDIINSIKIVVLSYFDFCIIPIVYYVINKTFFPTYGHVFGSYNAVTIGGLVKSLLNMPRSIIMVFLNIADWWINSFSVFSVVIIIVALLLSIFTYKKENNQINKTRIIEYFIYGFVLLIIGLVPYVMVRGKPIYNIGVKGRDAILVPFGVSVILYSLMMVLREKLRKIILTLIIVYGIISFNDLYIEWQKDYYYQLSLENLFNNDLIRDNDTFFLTDLNETKIEAQRYYSLNANALNVFGDETRFFVPKVSNLYLLENKENIKIAVEELNYCHVMRDYNPDDLCFDAVLDYDCTLSDLDVLTLKTDELFNKERFEDRIRENGLLRIYVVENDFTTLLLNEYNKDNLHDDKDVLDVVKKYEEKSN